MFKCFSWICFQDLICFLAATLQLSVFYYCFNISWFLLVIVCSASLHFTKSISVASFVFVQAFSEHISRLPDNQLEKEELKWKGSLVWKAKKNKPQPWRAAASCRPVEVVLEENGMREPGRAGGLECYQLPSCRPVRLSHLTKLCFWRVGPQVKCSGERNEDIVEKQSVWETSDFHRVKHEAFCVRMTVEAGDWTRPRPKLQAARGSSSSVGS